MTTWLGLALTAALCESLKDLFSKQGLRLVQPLSAAVAASGSAFPFLLGFFFLTQSMPPFGEHFIAALLVGGTLNIIALIQFMRAIQASDLSLTIPFITFTPLFFLITSPLIVGEFPGVLGLLGMVAIVLGAYTLHVQEVHRGFLVPVFAIVKEKGPRRMLSVAFIYSITSNVDKLGVLNSSPLFWSLSLNAFMMIGLVSLWLVRRAPDASIFRISRRSPWRAFLLVGAFHALTLIAQNLAFVDATVPSVITIKRTSVLFAVLWGALVFRETHVRERLVGAALMVLGIVLIALGERT